MEGSNMKNFIRCLLLLALAFIGQAQAADANLIRMIIQCESSGRNDVCGDDGISCGIAQFRKETFYEFAKMAKLHHAQWHSAFDQIILLDWGLDHGYARRWTCYRMIKAGTYPKKKLQKRGKVDKQYINTTISKIINSGVHKSHKRLSFLSVPKPPTKQTHCKVEQPRLPYRYSFDLYHLPKHSVSSHAPDTLVMWLAVKVIVNSA
jgi:hypothetical protein